MDDAKFLSCHLTTALSCHLWVLDLLGYLSYLCSFASFLGNQMTLVSEEVQRVSSCLYNWV